MGTRHQCRMLKYDMEKVGLPVLSRTDVTHIDCENCEWVHASECNCDRTEVFECLECGFQIEMDAWVSPDEPCCPQCWNGNFSDTPKLRSVEEAKTGFVNLAAD